MQLKNIVSDYNKQLRKIKDEMSLRFKGELKTAFKEIFTAYPLIKQITWTQYTPYFNDGEPCVFSVNDVYVLDETVNEGEDDWYDWVDVGYGAGAKKYPLLKDVSRCLSDADDLLLEMFGDHCRVVVTPSGIDVEEYEHE